MICANMGGSGSIVGAFPAVGHPEVDALERAFLNQHVVYPDNPEGVVHYRWTRILERLPAMRGLHLYDDLTDVLAFAEIFSRGATLRAAFDLACLQEHFWQLLFDNGMARTHVYGYQTCVYQMWRRRLHARIMGDRGWHRDRRGRLKKPTVVPAPGSNNWRN